MDKLRARSEVDGLILWGDVLSANLPKAHHFRIGQPCTPPPKQRPGTTMPWPSVWPFSSSSVTKESKDEKTPTSLLDDLPKGRDWNHTLTAFDWQHYTQPSVIVPSVLLTVTTLFMVHLYKKYLRRIPSTEYIRPGFFRRRSLFGTVTRVGDGDNFRLFHTPGGRLAGWGWSWRKVPTDKKVLTAKTVWQLLSFT